MTTVRRRIAALVHHAVHPRGASGYVSERQRARHFNAQDWSDGLPIVPPTIARVEEFLAHTHRSCVPRFVAQVFHFNLSP